MVDKISKAAGKASDGEKKPVVHREDPVLKAERLLAEAKAKAKQTANRRLEVATGEFTRASNQTARWAGLKERALERLNLARRDLELPLLDADGNEVVEPAEG
jgi:hypothetical protein